MASTKPLLVNSYLRQLWDRQGTDLLITAGSPPLLRIDGVLQAVEGEKSLEPKDTESLALNLLANEQATEFIHGKEIDFSFNWEGKARFRGNAFHQRGSVAVSLRLIPFEIPGFKELGLPPAVDDLVRLPQGLILMTGPTGAGKSTTQASMIDWINENRALHVLTIEDPIEYLHQHKR